MKQWLTGDDLFNWLDMLRATDERAFVVLEGTTDCQALDPHIDEAFAATFPAHSKSAAKRALELADARNLPRVVVVLDRDWVDDLEAPESSPNVVYTDDYDLDATMVLAGDVMNRVLSAQSRRESRQAHLSALGIDAHALVISLTSIIGMLRYVSERDRFELRCDGFPVNEVVSSDWARVEIDRLSVIAVKRSRSVSVTASVVESRVVAMGGALRPPRWFCNGHDIAAVISGLIHHWGGSASRAAVEKAVRSSFSRSDLEDTTLYQDVCSWADSLGARVWSATATASS